MQIPPFLLDQWLNEYHFALSPPEFDLASSTGPVWTSNQLLGLISPDEKKRLLNLEMTYSPAAGSARLRQAVGEMHGVEAEQVRIVTGASEALLVLFLVAAQPDANVILPFPLFPTTAAVADIFRLETRFYHLRRENNFAVDLDEIKKLTDENTRLILVNTPHNPTGAILSDEELVLLHDFAAERSIQFVSDEIYHPIYHGRETSSAAHLPRATVLGGFSKSLSLSGLRVGWIVEHDQVRLQQYTDARGYFTISNAVLSEELALIALQHRSTILDRARTVAASNLKLLDQFFNEHTSQLGWVRPRGGMTVFPWLTDGSDARLFCRALAERGVLLAPGDCFQMPNHFRLGFGVTATGFASALEKISDFLKTRPLSASA